MTPVGGTTIDDSGVYSDEDGYAQYDDTGSGGSLGLLVDQMSCAWGASPNDDFVLLAYVIQNTSGATLSGLFAGLHAEMDVDDDFNSDDWTAYDASRDMGYAWDPGSDTHVGLRFLTDAVSAYNNGPDVGCADSHLYPEFSNGQFDGTYGPDQVEFNLSTGPFSLAPGESTMIGTAWVMGSSLGDLRDNADQALAMWESSDGCGVGLPEDEEEFVPEPGSVALLASGLMGLAGYAGLRLRKR